MTKVVLGFCIRNKTLGLWRSEVVHKVVGPWTADKSERRLYPSREQAFQAVWTMRIDIGHRVAGTQFEVVRIVQSGASATAIDTLQRKVSALEASFIKVRAERDGMMRRMLTTKSAILDVLEG